MFVTFCRFNHFTFQLSASALAVPARWWLGSLIADQYSAYRHW